MAIEQPLSQELQTSFLSSVIEFMVRVGVSEREIRRSFETGIVRARRLTRAMDQHGKKAQYHADGDVSAYLLRLWNRDHRLVDGVKLVPRPLPLSRGKYNLRSLVASIDPNVDPQKVLDEMKAAGLIRLVRGGRYVPADDGAIFSSLHPWAIEHTARSVIRLVNTVYRNAGASAGGPKLLERYSYVPDLDPANKRAFAEFSRMQGLNYLQAIDDWLEQKRVSSASGRRRMAKGLAAGVHLITYLDEAASPALPIRPRKSLRSKSKKLQVLVTPISPPSTPA